MELLYQRKLIGYILILFIFYFILRGHSVFSSPPQWPMTSDFEEFSIPDLIHYIYLLVSNVY